MADNVVLLSDLANEIGLDKSNARKYALKQGVSFIRTRTQESGGQQVLALTLEEADIVRAKRQEAGFGGKVFAEVGPGFFYIVQPLPDLAPLQVKLGFAADPRQRLDTYKTICPNARIIETWPCKFAWEKAAIASITRIECVQIGQEVFSFKDLDSLVNRAREFFALMPSLAAPSRATPC